MSEATRRTGLPTVSLLLISLVSAAAVAQELAALEEVVVTAQRREERLQTLPIAASAFSTEQLERAQISNLDALQYATPNFTNAPSQTSRTSTSFAMRGQVVRDTTPTIDPAIGLYLDGVYFGRMTGANLDLVDMERVEVLRGPQGTLFGRNTIGGAINLIPRRPSFDVGGAVKATVGNFGRVELSGALNVPLAGNRYAVRIAALHTQHRGYGRNALLGADLNDDDTDFVRTQLRFAPSDQWDLNLAVDYSRIDTGAQLRTLLYVSPDIATLPVILGNPADSLLNYVDPVARTVASDRNGSVTTRVWGGSATLKIDFAHFTFKSISAWRGLEARATDSEQDGTPYDLAVMLFRDDRQHQLSQEFQAYGAALDGRLEWIGGLHYFDERGTFDQRSRTFAPATARWTEDQPSGDAGNDSLAAYAQATFALMPRLRVTAGARYNEDGRQLTSRNARIVGVSEVCQLDPAIRDQPGVCQATLPVRRFRYAPWALGVDFRPMEDAMFYARLSRGHRSGGYNLRGATLVDLSTYEPEKVTAYEVGAKSELFDHRLRVNLALFHSHLDDIQLLQRAASTPGVPGTQYIQNAGAARIAGGELEVMALWGPWRLAGNLGMTRAAYTQIYPNVVQVTLDSRILDTPDTTASLAADFPVAASFGQINFHADYSWRSDVPFQYDPNSRSHQPAYGLLNAMLSARFDRENLELSLWARNLTDRRYITRAFEADLFISATPGDPRTFGMSLAYRVADR